jgi:hypothetical protein
VNIFIGETFASSLFLITSRAFTTCRYEEGERERDRDNRTECYNTYLMMRMCVDYRELGFSLIVLLIAKCRQCLLAPSLTSSSLIAFRCPSHYPFVSTNTLTHTKLFSFHFYRLHAHAHRVSAALKEKLSPRTRFTCSILLRNFTESSDWCCWK